MRTNLEKLIVIFIVSVFALTSITILIVQDNSLTREEAIEISRNTPIVQEALNNPHTRSEMMIIEADYWNATYIRLSKERQPNVDWSFLPDDHGVWRIHWDITPPGYQILHFTDELTGQILYESWFIAG